MKPLSPQPSRDTEPISHSTGSPTEGRPTRTTQRGANLEDPTFQTANGRAGAGLCRPIRCHCCCCCCLAWTFRSQGRSLVPRAGASGHAFPPPLPSRRQARANTPVSDRAGYSAGLSPLRVPDASKGAATSVRTMHSAQKGLVLPGSPVRLPPQEAEGDLVV